MPLALGVSLLAELKNTPFIETGHQTHKDGNKHCNTTLSVRQALATLVHGPADDSRTRVIHLMKPQLK